MTGNPGQGPVTASVPGASCVTPEALYQAAVIGSPVTHSLSPVLHRAAYEAMGLTSWCYSATEVRPEELGGLLERVAAPAGRGPAWAGLSVTMPHKQAVLAHLDALDPLAAVVGCVNTVVAQRPGRGAALLTGFNTDVAGMVGALRETMTCPPALTGTGFGHRDHPAALQDRPRRGVVLGSGATACSALVALTELGVSDVTVAARRHAGPGRALTAAHRMGTEVSTITWRPGQDRSDEEVAEAVLGADLLVSTLPAGVADVLASPLGRLLARHGGARAGAAALDVAYAPWPSALAQVLGEAGVDVAPGWLMLLHQAAPQVRLMTGREPDLDAMRLALGQALQSR